MGYKMKIAILGRKKDTVNYEAFVEKMPATPITTLSPGDVSFCDALILPGGGDITPILFGEHNTGSRNMDTELDILQFQALELALQHKLPILGICKGMQLINIAFGGTIIQDMPDSSLHRYQNGDMYHSTNIQKASCLYDLYGEELTVNSAHHQCVEQIGSGLHAIQWCSVDQCVEALMHKTLPILGLQWHPERLNAYEASGLPVLSLLHSWIVASRRVCDEEDSL
ncbi:MAG: gamma-glutamyl-gamma-aminobutyrate hydrolase family protein [Lachnospiraceae bacterium]|nr:gamma-glutamyl-gamma-aminobutyrate hydrolase family protein [Lachnospiraceae bacterium]